MYLPFKLYRGCIKALHYGKADNLMYMHHPIAANVLTLLHGTLSKLLFREEIKAIQRIVIALGHMSVKETSSSFLTTTLDLIFSLCRSKVGILIEIFSSFLKIILSMNGQGI